MVLEYEFTLLYLRIEAEIWEASGHVLTRRKIIVNIIIKILVKYDFF
jgi:hypothetical protein